MSELALPEGLTQLEPLGEGRRSQVYRAFYRGDVVVVKAYKPAYIKKYEKQYQVNIGEFEYARNNTAYQMPNLTKYIAKPYTLLRPEQGYTLALIQEYVDGIWLEDLLQQEGALPAEVLQAGYYIVEQAAKLGLYDLDISPGNIRVFNDVNGQWFPKLYDFNLMPQHMSPPNPFMALGFKLGLRSKNYRDFRSLKHWDYLGQQASKNS